MFDQELKEVAAKEVDDDALAMTQLAESQLALLGGGVGNVLWG